MTRSPRHGAPAGGRGRARRVETAKGRKASSTRWLRRQLNDPFVRAARHQGYRSRAAFKLIQLDARFALLRPGQRVLDLGAAPGGWTQVALERVEPEGPRGGAVVGVDLEIVEPLAGARLVRLDLRDAGAPARLAAALGGPCDVILSDMAPRATGHAGTDHLRVVALCEAAFALVPALLRPGGAFVAKVLKGGTERDLLVRLKRDFREVRHAKPPASRAESAETYVVCRGFRGRRGPV